MAVVTGVIVRDRIATVLLLAIVLLVALSLLVLLFCVVAHAIRGTQEHSDRAMKLWTTVISSIRGSPGDSPEGAGTASKGRRADETAARDRRGRSTGPADRTRSPTRGRTARSGAAER